MKKLLLRFKKYMYQDILESGTSKEWSEWKKKAKRNKIRWFLTDTLPMWLKSTFIWPIERACDWVRYRTYGNYRKINIRSLQPDYYDKRDLMLHGMFQLLVDFIEIEKAIMQWYFCEVSKFSWLKRKITRFKPSGELGIKYLDWEISLSDPKSDCFDNLSYCEEAIKKYGSLEEYKKSDDYKMSQSYFAQEQKELYLWWKVTRPLRVCHMDVKGEFGYSWSDWCEIIRKKYPDEIFHDDKTDEEKKISNSALKVSHDYEVKYEKEDEEMLIRLIKIRQSLWT